MTRGIALPINPSASFLIFYAGTVMTLETSAGIQSAVEDALLDSMESRTILEYDFPDQNTLQVDMLHSIRRGCIE